MAFNRLAATAALVLAFGLAGCATGPVNTANPSTGDLLFRWDDLTTHLAKRRQELDGMQRRVAALNASLSQQLTALGTAQAEIEQLQTSRRATEKEVAALTKETAELQQKSAAVRTRLRELQQEKANLEATKISSQPQAADDATRIAALNKEISTLEGEIGVLERGIQRTYETRKNILLRSE